MIGFSSEAGGTVKFDLSNGTVITESNDNLSSAKIEDYGNGWYRCSVIATADASGTALFGFNSELNINGNNFYIYGAQFEEGSYATSLINTSGSAVTRQADVCTNGANSEVINSTEGVLYAEIAALADDGTFRQILLHDNAYNNRIALRYTNVSNQIDVYLNDGSVQAQFNYTLTNALDFNKIAFKYKVNDFALWLNGIEVATDSSGTTFSANTLQKIDFDFTNNYFFYGNVKDLQVFTTALTDAELAALTSL